MGVSVLLRLFISSNEVCNFAYAIWHIHEQNSIFKYTTMGPMIPKEMEYNLHYGDVRDWNLSKVEAALKGKNLLPEQILSFKSSPSWKGRQIFPYQSYFSWRWVLLLLKGLDTLDWFSAILIRQTIFELPVCFPVQQLLLKAVYYKRKEGSKIFFLLLWSTSFQKGEKAILSEFSPL